MSIERRSNRKKMKMKLTSTEFVKYPWKSVSADVIQTSLNKFRKQIIASMTKSNALLDWMIAKPERERVHYMDMSVSLDFILETTEPYYG